MDAIRVLIADDDVGMRLLLRKLIERHEDFTLIGEAKDGGQVLSLVESLKPEVVFLDVEMPVQSGVECAHVIQDYSPKTVIIFATAHEGYMSDAFEVYAFDYLVKPFKLERVEQTLDRVRDRLRSQESVVKQIPVSKITTPVTSERMMLRHKDGVSFLDYQSILLVQREDRSTVLYTSDGGKYITGDPLSEIERRLPSAFFFRCHKSYIINLNHIRDITPYGRWTYVVRLNGIKQDALITHEKYDQLEKMFGA